MNESTPPLTQLKDLLPQVNSIILVVTANPTFDHLSSALSLYLGLKSMGKEVEIVCPDPMIVEFNQLIGIDEVKAKLGNKNLSISFEYREASVDKVSYHIDEEHNKFYLIIKPQKGSKPLDTATVSFDYTGAESDLVVLIGVHNYEDLEHLYTGYEQLYEQATVVTLHTFEPAIGLIHLTTNGASCMAEVVARMLEYLTIPVDSDMATNLLAGIESSTQSFSSFTTTAETFETVAYLLKLGARRMRLAPLPHQMVDHPFVAQTIDSPKANGQTVELLQSKAAREVTIENKTDHAAQPQRLTTNQASPQSSPPPSRSRKKNKRNRPGGLDYQPSGINSGSRS